MFFQSDRTSVNSVFCDFSSSFFIAQPDDFFTVYNLKWPDDFEDKAGIGTSRFQVINDFKSGLYLFNHEGNLYPFTERKILVRQNKIRKDVITEKFGKLPPFHPDDIYSLETGFNSGNVEFMTFNASQREKSSFKSYRKVLYRFFLFRLLQNIVELKEMQYKKKLRSQDIEKLEESAILNHAELKEWKFEERDILPSQDEYIEKVEFALKDYHFNSKDDYVDVRLKFELFHE